jgi:hypothetical protein
MAWRGDTRLRPGEHEAYESIIAIREAEIAAE